MRLSTVLSAVGRRLDLILPLLVLIAALVVRVYEPPLVERLRNLAFDSYQRLMPRPVGDAPVRIIDIDEASLEKIGQWPWPRDILAQLVDRLSEAGAAAIAFDVLFAEPDRLSPQNLLQRWQHNADIARLGEVIGKLPDPDAELAKSLGKANSVVPFALIEGPGRGTPELKAGFAVAGDDALPFAPAFTGAVTTLPALEKAAKGNGSVTSIPDADGIIRRIPLIFRLGDKLYPSLAGEALRVAQPDANSYVIKSSGASGEGAFGAQTGINHIRVGQFIAPTDEHGRVLLWDSGSHAARFFPAWSVLSRQFVPGAFEGQIVLIGTSVEGLKDVKSTPLSGAMPGVEIHAQLLEQMINGQFLERPDWALAAELALMILLGIVLIFVLRLAGPIWSAAVGLAFAVGAVAISWFAFTRLGWLIDPLFPSFAALAVYLSGSAVGYARTEVERRWIRGAFGQYLSPVLVEQLTHRPDLLKLGGELRELSIMFCDIRDFTALSEKLDPHALTHLINGFLTPMTQLIQQKDGTIDKYIGDCIMAFWNAPLDVPNHAERAVSTVIAMREELKRLNQAWAAEAERENRAPVRLAIGMGINTGRCVVGNMGSEQRFDYSALGDSVNLASRLEGLSKAYGVDIVVGEDSAAAAPGYNYVELDQVRVKGRQQPLRIFTVLDETPAADQAAQHQAMITAYRRQDWSTAKAALAACRSMASLLHSLYDLYEARIAEYSTRPPPPDWDGVYVALTKSG
jgi:adenylate cyclase